MLLQRPMSRAWPAIAALAAVLAPSGPVAADTIYEGPYLPTGSVVTVPTSSSFATSYVVPSSYTTTTYLPTTSVLAAESYIPTYRSTRFRARRYVERTNYVMAPSYYSVAPTSYFLPTSYVLPTTYLSSSYVLPRTYLSSSYVSPASYLLDTELVTTSGSVCCETAAPAVAQRTVSIPPPSIPDQGGSTITSVPSGSSAAPPAISTERRPSAAISSTPSTDDALRSDVNPPVTAAPAPPRPGPGTAAARPQGPDSATPPAPPYPEKKSEELVVPDPGAIGAGPRPNELSYRARKPSSYDVRNILRGNVVSYDSGRPEEGVTVVVSSVTNNYGDRTAMSDALGEFKVSLPDGDWTVKVKMPSGQILGVGRDFVTASSGRVLDPTGRGVGEFLITR